MAEVAVFAEQFAVIRSDGDVGVFRERIEQLFDHSVEIFDGGDLPVAQFPELGVIERTAFAGAQFAANDMVIEMSENAMDTADARPVFGWFVRERVRVMRFADI